jgi:hypothetical protein
MGRYASQTTVSPEKSRAEIEQILSRYGADAFGYGYEERRAVVQFRAHERQIRFVIETPERDEFKKTPTGQWRYDDQIDRAWQQGIRQRWRALALVIKAKLEAVEAGVTSFEEEFMPFILLPNGQTVGDVGLPAIDRAYSTGEMPDFALAIEGPKQITAGTVEVVEPESENP